jgi:hypothetical protein
MKPLIRRIGAEATLTGNRFYPIRKSRRTRSEMAHVAA